METTTFRTIKTSDLTSADTTICVPDEVHIYETGKAVACHAQSGDVEYASLAELEADYLIEVAPKDAK